LGWEMRERNADGFQAMDKHAYVTGHGLKTQSIAQQNKCTVPDMVKEPLDGCKSTSHTKCWSRY
jgi:hypothetical protein